MPVLLRNFLLLSFFVCFYAACYNALLNHRTAHAIASQRSTLWTLPPLALKALAGEFKGLAADLIVLEAGAQLGTEVVRDPQGGFRTVKKQYDWDSISRLFFNSQALDPSFQQTFMLAQGWLPWEAGMITETQDILKTAAQGRPWDWQPAHLIGFNHYYFLNQPAEAGKIFLEAAKTPKSPPFLAILGARLALKGGETEAAILLMQSMLKDKTEADEGYADMVDRMHALEGVRVLELAVAQYKEKFGEFPNRLSALTDTGILAALPPNPYKANYCIDPEGRVHFDTLNCQPSR